jgi:hypothetical protein
LNIHSDGINSDSLASLAITPVILEQINKTDTPVIPQQKMKKTDTPVILEQMKKN